MLKEKYEYPKEIINNVKTLFGSDSKEFKYAVNGSKYLGLLLNDATDELDDYPVYFTEGKESIKAEQEKLKILKQKHDLYFKWVEFVENEDSDEGNDSGVGKKYEATKGRSL